MVNSTRPEYSRDMKKALVATLVLVLGVSTFSSLQAASAKRKAPFCKTASKQHKAKKKLSTSKGVTLYYGRNDYLLCSAKKRRKIALPNFNDELKPVLFAANPWKCVAIVAWRKGTLPEVWNPDLKKRDSARITPIGYGYQKAQTTKLVLTRNCVAVTGSIVDNGDGTVHRRIDAIQFLDHGRHHTFGQEIPKNADLKTIKARPKGKAGAIVTWRQGGKKMSYDVR